MRFKGDRDYLHGTDILPIALHALSGGQRLDAIRDTDIVFHALARTGLTLCVGAPAGCEPKARLGCSIEGRRHKFLLVEDGRPITERHPYPEDQIIAATTIDTASATATSSAHLSFANIERWIAMIKALHHAVYPDTRGKWLFARANSPRITTRARTKRNTVWASSPISGGKLTRSALTVDGRNIGDSFSP
jgi:hypothetical protein